MKMKINNIREKNINQPFKGDFYDENYFENGQESGKGWLQNYRWMPRRTFKEAFAIIDYLNLDDNSYVLDVGCAKGFIVRALRELEIKTDGCDISDYALSFAPEGCWNCTSWESHYNFGYTHIIVKDMLEHLTIPQLDEMLQTFKNVAEYILCVIPIGDNGLYRIPEYHMEVSHLIAENEEWWSNKFIENGWTVEKHTPHVVGMKDNWQNHANGLGNHVFVLKK
jgi:cyclopropane fatty-acyl-phospholipid synthase-like methyltransferase